MLFFFTGKLSFWEAMLANMSPKTITTSRCDTLEAIAAALRSDKLEFGLSFDIRRNGLFGLLFSDTVDSDFRPFNFERVCCDISLWNADERQIVDAEVCTKLFNGFNLLAAASTWEGLNSLRGLPLS
mmetsp:Transcript_6040/g.6920  ORF Transcript_6040/g.6920 Transcript_6040/m.6920 type:complete len:127 (-) Transcript_6040:545-925(-)